MNETGFESVVEYESDNIEEDFISDGFSEPDPIDTTDSDAFCHYLFETGFADLEFDDLQWWYLHCTGGDMSGYYLGEVQTGVTVTCDE